MNDLPPVGKTRRRPTLPGGLPPSTIGAGGLNYRVRNGNGCFPTAMATGNLWLKEIYVVKGGRRRAPSLKLSIASTSKDVLQALGRLVPVG